MAEKAEATVVFGVLNETSEHESRVALTPDIVTRLRKSGVTCLIESGAGVASHYVDEDYTKAGAQVVSADDVIARADALGFVDRPSNELLARVKQGTWIIGMLGSFTDADYVAAIEKTGLVGVAMEKLPRQLSSAQSMDEMTSQNSVMDCAELSWRGSFSIATPTRPAAWRASTYAASVNEPSMPITHVPALSRATVSADGRSTNPSTSARAIPSSAATTSAPALA